MSAVFSTTALMPFAALAQSQQDCDTLMREIDARQGQQLAVTREQATAFMQASDFAGCRTALQQVQAQAQPGQAPAGEAQTGQAPAGEAQQGQAPAEAGASNITVQQPAPTITVAPAAPQVSVQQTPPNVTVRQPQPEIIVRQPAPVVTIDIPQPEIIVRMPQPEVAVEQAAPQVQVQQAQPQVQVVEQEQPQVQVQEGQQPVVNLTEAEGQANVQVEQTGEANVTYERAEPQVTINQAEGQPTITVEQMQGEAGAAGQAQPMAGQDTAATQQRDSEDQNATPEAQEGAGGAQQQATATQAGQAGGMQRILVSDMDGMDVVNERGEQLGDVETVVRSAADNKMYVVIDQGGFLGLGEKRVALSMEGLMLQNDRVVVPGLSDEEIQALPEFESSDQFPEVEDTVEGEFRTMAQ